MEQKIKHIRSRLGWTQSQLGKYMNVSRDAVAKWEMGIRSPSEVHRGILIQMDKRLNKLDSEREKEQFKEGIKVAIGSGLIALIIWLFPSKKNKDD